MQPIHIKYLKEVLGVQSFMMPLEPTKENQVLHRPIADPLLEYESQNKSQGEHITSEGSGKIIFLGAKLLTEGASKALLTKMVLAMGLNIEDVIVAELNPNFIEDFKTDIWNEIKSFDCLISVIFGEDLNHYLFDEVTTDWNGKWHSKNGISCLGTWAPKDLLENEKLKRIAWADLKKVMAKKELMEF